MSLAMTIFSLVAAWISIAISMLWGMMRIARRHHALVAHNNMAGHAPLTNTLDLALQQPFTPRRRLTRIGTTGR